MRTGVSMASPISRCLALALAAAAVAAAGCAVDKPAAAPATSGLSIPLIQPGMGSTVFRLDARFEVTTPDGTVIPLDGSTGDSVLELTLEPGIHSIRILDGWTLERSDDGVNFAPVSALLGSVNPANIRIRPDRTSTFSFQFLVRTTTGELRLTFGVDETPRELSSALRFTQGVDEFAPYVGVVVDMAVFFSDDSQTTVVNPDGSRDRVYDSFSNGLEFFNDSLGLLGPLAAASAGGSFELTNRAAADGTLSFQGFYFGSSAPFVDLTFGPSGFASFPIDADGTPADGTTFASAVPLEITRGGVVILRGTMSSLRVF